MEKKTLYFICLFVLPTAIIGLSFAYFIMSFNFPLDKTNPDIIFDKYEGSISLTPKSYLDFEKYCELNQISLNYNNTKKRDVLAGSSLFTVKTLPTLLPIPTRYIPLSYYPYTNTNSNTIKQCKSKFITVNLSNYKYKNFGFNYSDSHFDYKLKVYDDVYSFSDRLKTEDCYIDENNYELSFFKDPYNNKFIESVSQEFKKLENQGYSNNEIVEIATIFVQSIPYGSDSSDLNRYPYETIYEKNGNCLDKAVILAGILKNMNYDVSIVTGNAVETGENHAIVGIKCSNPETKAFSTCYIETTNFYPISSNLNDFLSQSDSVISISTGTNIYSEIVYGPKLNSYIEEQIEAADEIEKDIDNRSDQLNSIENELYDIKSKMLSTDCAFSYYCNDADYYNFLTDEFNIKVDDYNDIVRENWLAYIKLEKIYFDHKVKMFDNID